MVLGRGQNQIMEGQNREIKTNNKKQKIKELGVSKENMTIHTYYFCHGSKGSNSR
jgi:hypothetical protein